MRILFIGEPGSIHAVRWMSQFKDLGWDLHIFSGSKTPSQPSPELNFGTLYTAIDVIAPHGLKIRRIPPPETTEDLAAIIAQLVKEIEPDIVHTLGLCVNWENRALPVALAKEILAQQFTAPWIYSSWGADLDFFGAQPEQAPFVNRVLRQVDYHISECCRDERLASSFGFCGVSLPRMPAFGGVSWQSPIGTSPPSKRRVLVLKGRDISDGDPVGRALHIVYAILGCHDVLKDFTIKAVQVGDCVASWLDRLQRTTGLTIKRVPRLPQHNQVISLIAESRVFIAMTVNDGLPSSLVEAMSLGSLPIHSSLEPISEWINDGVNGSLVDVNRIADISKAIRRAALDDQFVDEAARINSQIVHEKLDYENVRRQAVAIYQDILTASKQISVHHI